MKSFYTAIAVATLTAAFAMGQIAGGGVPGIADEPPGGLKPGQPPVLSPPAQTSVTIAGQKITIKYSAPSMRKRVIFGELVPWRQVWRAGANDATLLHTTADLEFNGLLVPKGDYSLFVLPDLQQWQLIVNKETGQSGLEYHAQQDLGRVPMELSHPPKALERYRMTLSKSAGGQGQLQLAWEKTVATITFTVRAPK